MPFALLVDTYIKTLKSLNPKKLWQLAFLLIITAAGYTFWENRPVIYNALSVGLMENAVIESPLQEKTRDLIKTIVNEKKSIVAVQVVQTDFGENSRHSVFFYSDIDELNKDQEKFASSRISTSPLLIPGDLANNERIIAIMEQEFVCTPVPPRIAYGIPLSTLYAKQMCALSVPPTYGKMGGYVTVWMKDEISKQDMPDYKRLARTISQEDYRRDFLKRAD